ncbi:integrase, partial [Bradyrhizobium sp. Leo121]
MSHPPATASEPLAAAPSDADLPSPLPPSQTGLPAHLERLADRARGYVEAASSAN